MKYFTDEIIKFYDKVKNNEHFSLVRYGDGEWYIFVGNHFDITNKCNGEFKFDPNNRIDMIHRDMLINSLNYKDDSYYVGIMTICSCYKEFKFGGFELMKFYAKQDDEHLTFASVFNNYNYHHMVKPKLLPLLYEKDKVLVVNHKADITKIPNVSDVFRVGTNAWVNDIRIVDKLLEYVKDVKDKYFLVCAGPLSNIIIHQLHRVNKNNTYINFGSCLDEVMFSEATRWYQHDLRTMSHCCLWENEKNS